MSRLNIKGRVFYLPGPWGINKPVAGAQILITDIDLPGRGNDVIFSGKADSQGRFSGRSNDWQDQVNVRVWRPSSTIPGVPVVPGIGPGRWVTTTQPDVTDIMTLTARIRADGQDITVPFPYAGDNVEVKLFVTWGPPPKPAHGTINGLEFTDFQKLMDKLTATIETKEPIALELYGDWSDAVTPLVELINTDPLELVKQYFPDSLHGSLIIAVGGLFFTITAAELLAMAALVLAIGGMILLVGASVFLVALGIAVILAVLAGYCQIGAEQDTTTDSNGNPENRTRISLLNAGCF